jgi:hypothetical protein
MAGAVRAGRSVRASVRARDLTMGMLLACTSLVANAVVSGSGSLAPRTAAELPEPFTVLDAAAMPTAFASSTPALTGSGLVVPDTGTGQSDDGSFGHRTDGAVAPSAVVPVAPVENPVAVPPGSAPASEPVRGVSGDEPEGPMAPVLQPVTELLAPAPSAATEVAEVTEPALSMLSPSLFA